jgi:hypothetical protein
VANDDDKDADGHMVEMEFLSVFDTLLRECAQGQQQSLREAISEFWQVHWSCSLALMCKHL